MTPKGITAWPSFVTMPGMMVCSGHSCTVWPPYSVEIGSTYSQPRPSYLHVVLRTISGKYSMPIGALLERRGSMGMSGSVTIREEDYRQVEASIAGTPEGRAFLEEHARRARTMGVEEVMALVGGLRDAWVRHEAASNAVRHIAVLRHELQDMSASIVQARREIAAIRPKEGGTDRIATAANELDAIVLSTERASIEILGAAERILEALPELRAAGGAAAACDLIEHEVMGIFTACSFQDLTGQRTTKVVNALRYIEQRIMAVMEIWGVEGVSPAAPPAGPVDTRPDAHLLNGPSSDGVGQDEVDRLLNGPAPAPLDQNSIDALFG